MTPVLFFDADAEAIHSANLLHVPRIGERVVIRSVAFKVVDVVTVFGTSAVVEVHVGHEEPQCEFCGKDMPGGDTDGHGLGECVEVPDDEEPQ